MQNRKKTMQSFAKYGVPFVSGYLASRMLPMGFSPIVVGATMAGSRAAIDMYYADDKSSETGAEIWAYQAVYAGMGLYATGISAPEPVIVGSLLVVVLNLGFSTIFE